MFRNLFPGFGIAVVAFSIYVAFENILHPTNVEALKEQAKEAHEGQGILRILKERKG